MKPSHRHMTPVRPSATSKPVFAMSKAEATIAAQTWASPSTSHWWRPARNAAKKKPAQTAFSMARVS